MFGRHGPRGVSGVVKVEQRRLYRVEEKPGLAEHTHELGVSVAQANCHAAFKSRNPWPQSVQIDLGEAVGNNLPYRDPNSLSRPER